MITSDSAGLQQAAHRRSVSVERAELGVPRVGVSVKVDDADGTEAQAVGDSRNVWEGNRVVTAEHDGDRAGPYGPAYHLAQVRVALLDVAWRHKHVARIHNAQLLKRIEAETQVRSSRDVRLRVAEPDRVGAKARARAV